MEQSKSIRLRNWVFSNLVLILIILALILMLVIYRKWITDPILVSIIEKSSLAILSSGVFAAILKSIQFTGIFKDEIEKVVIGSDFIKNRRDLPDLWRSISQVLYKRKFPAISKSLENIILNTYLPTTEDYYYEDYIITIKIEEINDDFEISYTQTCKYNVVLDKEVDRAQLSLETSISQDADASEIINELEFFNINEEPADTKELDSTINDPTQSKYLIDLNGHGPFRIHSKFRRKYSLRNENYKLFRTQRFTKNMAVVINYPEDVRVSFFNIGMVNKFEKQHEEIRNQISRSHRNDVILPHQGFGMSFEKEKK